MNLLSKLLFSYSVLLLSILCPTANAAAQQDSSVSFTFGSKYFAEGVLLEDRDKNIETAYMGWLLFRNRLQLKNHALQVDFQITHGGTPAVDETMDLQVFSNIEAGYLYGIYEMYYEYSRENFWFKIGQIDINTDFMVSESGLHFVHSSFGIDPLSSTNIPGPTFPWVGFSATSEYKVNDTFQLRAGLFDGQFAKPRGNFIPVEWKLSRSEGYLIIAEPELNFWNDRLQLMPGFLYHSGSFPKVGTGDRQSSYLEYYLIGDFSIVPKMGDKGSVHLFFQYSSTPSQVGFFSDYYAGGFLWKQTLPWEIENDLGVAFAHASGSDFLLDQGEFKFENALELSWRFQLKEWLHFKPYFMWLQQRAGDKTETIGKIAALRAVLEI